jgi:hypothetical protein
MRGEDQLYLTFTGVSLFRMLNPSGPGRTRAFNKGTPAMLASG